MRGGCRHVKPLQKACCAKVTVCGAGLGWESCGSSGLQGASGAQGGSWFLPLLPGCTSPTLLHTGTKLASETEIPPPARYVCGKPCSTSAAAIMTAVRQITDIVCANADAALFCRSPTSYWQDPPWS